jgi:flavodoxin
MNAVVIYGTRHGNTQAIAGAIAGGLKTKASVQIFPIETVPSGVLAQADLVVVGGPTEGHGVSEPVKVFFDDLAEDTFKGKLAASFDTRLQWPLWMSGSAANGIGGRLRRAGAELVSGPGSFIVKGKTPALEPGELTRAVEWGRSVARKASMHRPLPAAAGL